MDKIIIKGLKVNACHGVLTFEKTEPQPFIIDAELYLNFYGACRDDDLKKTVNYDEACNLLCDIAAKNSYNLIEKLACECALTLAEKYDLYGVKVSVFKPQAPVKAKVDTVGAEINLRRERVFLSLGSSLGDKKANLDGAIEELKKTRGINVKKVSSYIRTPPYGGAAKCEFLNCAAEIQTYLSPDNLLFEIHRIENLFGRTRDIRWGDRTLDIDIIFYGREIINSENLTIPHADWQNRAFVIAPLKEIAPDFICPVNNVKIGGL